MSYLIKIVRIFVALFIRLGMVNNNKVMKMASNTGSSLEKILADVSKQSATKQILIGAASGW